MNNLSYKLKVLDLMLKIFQDAAKERESRKDFISDPLDNNRFVPEWVLFERQKMFNAVNYERASHGFGPVEQKEIFRVEQMACGHTDYAHKYALYCTELALGYDKVNV